MSKYYFSRGGFSINRVADHIDSVETERSEKSGIVESFKNSLKTIVDVGRERSRTGYSITDQINSLVGNATNRNNKTVDSVVRELHERTGLASLRQAQNKEIKLKSIAQKLIEAQENESENDSNNKSENESEEDKNRPKLFNVIQNAENVINNMVMTNPLADPFVIMDQLQNLYLSKEGISSDLFDNTLLGCINKKLSENKTTSHQNAFDSNLGKDDGQVDDHDVAANKDFLAAYMPAKG